MFTNFLFASMLDLMRFLHYYHQREKRKRSQHRKYNKTSFLKMKDFIKFKILS